jgi:hypothetical protein
MLPIDRDSASIIAEYAQGSVHIAYIRRKRGNFSYDEYGTIMDDISHIPYIIEYNEVMNILGKNIFSYGSKKRFIAQAIEDDRLELLEWINENFVDCTEIVYKSVVDYLPSYAMVKWFLENFNDTNTRYTIISNAVKQRAMCALNAYIDRYGYSRLIEEYMAVKPHKKTEESREAEEWMKKYISAYVA